MTTEQTHTLMRCNECHATKEFRVGRVPNNCPVCGTRWLFTAPPGIHDGKKTDSYLQIKKRKEQQ